MGDSHGDNLSRDSQTRMVHMQAPKLTTKGTLYLREANSSRGELNIVTKMREPTGRQTDFSGSNNEAI